MKKATIETVTFKTEGTGDKGKWYLFTLKLSNGDEGQAFSNSNPPTEFSQGQEIEYDIKTETKGQYTNTKITLARKGGGFGGKGFDSKGANKRAALEAAAIMVASGKADMKVLELADKFNEWLSK